MCFKQQLLDGVATFFQTQGKVVKLNSYNLKKYASDAICGWAVELTSCVTVVLCLTEDFPSLKLPKVFLKNYDGFPNEYLHIEEMGKLCLDIKLDDVILDGGLEIIKATFKSAKNLVENLQKIDLNQPDYQGEFTSYWLKSNVKKGLYSVLSTPNESPSVISYINVGFQTVFFDDKESGLAWINKFLGKETKKIQADAVSTAIFVCLDELLVPSEFPSSGKELMTLAKTKGFDKELCNIIESEAKIVTVIFESKEDNEPYYFSISVDKQQPKKVKGFRPKHIPQSLMVRRSFDNQKAYPTNTCRIDEKWIHKRGGNVAGGLHGKHAIIVGCGSLGCQVALQLAQSGVNLTLVDDDWLLPENTARHLLGGKAYILQNKAKGLRNFLKERFPHLTIMAIDEKIQLVAKNDKQVFYDSDLVVSTTGSLSAEVHLAILGRTNLNMPPVIFGWFEPHAIAGQLLIVWDKGGCYFCEIQTRSYQVTKWDNSQEKKEPACGAYYQPYGAVDMAPIHAMVSRACLEVLNGHIERSEVRTWIGDTLLLSRLGGELSQMWKDKSIELGFQEFRDILSQNPECKLCKKV